MLLSYVLRLVPEALAEGRFAGTLHVVATGRTVAFSSIDELLVALTPRAREASEPPARARTIDLDAGRRPVAPRDPGP